MAPTNTDLHACSQEPLAHSLGPRSCQKLSSGLASPWLVASQNTGVSPRAFPLASGVSKALTPTQAPSVVLYKTLQRGTPG